MGSAQHALELQLRMKPSARCGPIWNLVVLKTGDGEDAFCGFLGGHTSIKVPQPCVLDLRHRASVFLLASVW